MTGTLDTPVVVATVPLAMGSSSKELESCATTNISMGLNKTFYFAPTITPQTSQSSASPSQNPATPCAWTGHCEGRDTSSPTHPSQTLPNPIYRDPCGTLNDCDGDLICSPSTHRCVPAPPDSSSSISPFPSQYSTAGDYSSCTLIGHCEGAACVDSYDCSGTLICLEGKGVYGVDVTL